MRHIIRGFAFLLIPIVVNGILGFMRQPQKAEKGKVYLHKFFAIFGTICSALFLIPAMITAFWDEPLWVPIIFLALASLGASLVIGFINCRITYDEEGFVAKNFLGITREFTYGQVTAIKENLRESYIYMGKRRVMVDQLAVGGYEFINLVKNKYRATHNGQSLPKITKTKYDLFNGNVTDAGGALFAYVLLAVLLIGFVIFTVVYTYFSPSTTSNTIEQSVSFISCHANQEEVVLTSADRQIYVIRFIDEQFDPSDVQAICDGKTVVTAYSTEVTPDDAEDYYSVKAIVHNGSYLLTFEETNRFHSQEYWPLIVIASGMLLIWGIYIAVSIVVARNPEKFSKRFVRFFFKDGYIRYGSKGDL